ncbi:unnamed protein product [Eretmochelys imbricata]
MGGCVSPVMVVVILWNFTAAGTGRSQVAPELRSEKEKEPEEVGLFLRLLLNSLAVGAEMTPPRDAEIQWGYLFSAYQVQMENNYANAGGLNLFGCELCSVHEGKSA